MSRAMSLERFDPVLANSLAREAKRQRETLNFIPSVNHSSAAVRRLVGSVYHDGYSEGYPKRRYYQGNGEVDFMEALAQGRGIELFGFASINVQPLSGSPANNAALRAMAQYGDIIMGPDISIGGHLTHGAKVSATSEDFDSRPYGATPDGVIDYDQLERDAMRFRPKVIIAGSTAYARIIDWERMAEIADASGAYLMVDMAHIAGLVAAGVHPSPVPYADVVTSTSHKTLRGPRGGFIGVTPKGLIKDPELPAKIDRAVFPKLQGGPHENVVAAMALAFREAATPEFKAYAEQILLNARALAERLTMGGARLITGGTDIHLLLMDATVWGISGKTLAEGLEAARIVTNANGMPFDARSPLNPSGLRMGTPAVTSRGLDEGHMEQIGGYVVEIANALSESKARLGYSDRDENNRAKRQLLVHGSVKVTREIGREILDITKSHKIPKSYMKAA